MLDAAPLEFLARFFSTFHRAQASAAVVGGAALEGDNESILKTLAADAHSALRAPKQRRVSFPHSPRARSTKAAFWGPRASSMALQMGGGGGGMMMANAGMPAGMQMAMPNAMPNFAPPAGAAPAAPGGGIAPGAGDIKRNI